MRPKPFELFRSATRPPRLALGQAEIDWFLATVVGDQPCQLCRGGNWTSQMVDATDAQVAALLRVCRSCGHRQLFARDAIDRLVQAHRRRLARDSAALTEG